MKECTTLEIFQGDDCVGVLLAADVHGQSGRNKSWLGTVDGKDIDLPNLKAVAAWAKDNDFDVVRA